MICLSNLPTEEGTRARPFLLLPGLAWRREMQDARCEEVLYDPPPGLSLSCIAICRELSIPKTRLIL